MLRVLAFAEAEIELLLSKRPYADLAALPGPVRRGNQRTRSDAFRIEAWGGGTGPTRTLVAVVRRSTDPTAGVVQASATPTASSSACERTSAVFATISDGTLSRYDKSRRRNHALVASPPTAATAVIALTASPAHRAATRRWNGVRSCAIAYRQP